MQIRSIDLYRKIITKIEDYANSKNVKPYIVSSRFGISQASYYDLKDYIDGKGDEKRILSNTKLKEVSKRCGFEILDVIYEIQE